MPFAKALTLGLIAMLATPVAALPIQLPEKDALATRTEALDAKLDDLPPAVIAAFVAQADRFFWERVRARKDSTLTATAIQLLMADTPTSWTQASPLEKDDAIEAMTALATPEQILTIYLNLAPMGEDVTGLTEAAKTYFDKTPKELTPAEAAWMAAVAGSPEIALIPANRDRTKSQRDYILRQMEKAGALTADALAGQLAQPMPDL